MVRSLMLSVQLMGGPFDGETVRIQSSIEEIEMVANIRLEHFLYEEFETVALTSAPYTTAIYRRKEDGKWWFVEERCR